MPGRIFPIEKNDPRVAEDLKKTEFACLFSCHVKACFVYGLRLLANNYFTNYCLSLTAKWRNCFPIFESCKINQAVSNNLLQPPGLCSENNYALRKKGRCCCQFIKMQLIIYNLQDWVIVLCKNSNHYIEIKVVNALVQKLKGG